MIRPGLQRISQLLADTSLDWRAVHIAGTNGKGSVCSYVASLLDTFNSSQLRALTGRKPISWGKFTSPHLIDAWDCIQINGRTIDKRQFDSITSSCARRNAAHNIDASEFERLTAIAFQAFNESKVDIGIVEVGMGGKQDATNILGTHTALGGEGTMSARRPPPLSTAITKIGLDHQAFLGNSLAEIAAQKAGIIKAGVPVAFDQSNDQEVLDVLQAKADELGAKVVQISDVLAAEDMLAVKPGFSSAAADNFSVALRATYAALAQDMPSRWKDKHNEAYRQYLHDAAAACASLQTPGRLDERTIRIDGRSVPTLIDGAHNAQSAARLAAYLAEQEVKGPLVWLYGASQGRDVEESLRLLLRPGDSLIAAEFGPVEGMLWVKPVSAAEVVSAARTVLHDQANTLMSCGACIEEALTKASGLVGPDGLLVVSGSLYLVGDVYRYLRSVGAGG